MTIGLLAAGEISVAKAAAYIATQLIGGILGAFTLSYCLGSKAGSLGATTLDPAISPLQGLVIEAILTFFLVNTILNAAVSGKAGGHAGLAIGLTLPFAILMGGPLTGASLNPARTLGPAIVTGNFADIWIYLVGPPLGAVVAGLLYKTVLSKP